MSDHTNIDDGNPSRREVLQTTLMAAAALVIGLRWPAGGAAAQATPAAGASFAPNAFLRIAADDTITIISKHLEMGQGIYTGVATMIAEELDADWERIRVEAAPSDAALYRNLAMGKIQGTGSSASIANSYEQMRTAGATARAMLVAAASQLWSVPVGEITVVKAVVRHDRSGRTARFGELAALAAKQPVPETVRLKDPSAFTLIGTSPRRLDTRAKVTGEAQYTIDVRLPGMLTAVVARPPVFGATLASFDATAAKAIPGVRAVVPIRAGVAVVADGFWAAKKGRDVLQLVWDTAKAEKRSTDTLLAEYHALAAQPGTVARRDGDADAAIAGAARTVEADFEFPYLVHAPMEPLDCVARFGAGQCEIWCGTQMPTVDQNNIAALTGLPVEKITVHTQYAGGAFGRRIAPDSDVVIEAVQIAQALGDGVPVKVIWTREDDIRGGRYRPMYVHQLSAGLDANGRIVGWRHRIVGQSFLTGTPFQGAIKDGIDPTSVKGARDMPYAVPAVTVELQSPSVGVPVLWWRSNGSTHTAFATEAFVDRIAALTGQDPLAFRRSMLAGKPRHRAVLDLAAEKAGWGRPLSAGRARGIAVAESYKTYVAQVAEVSRDGQGRIRVDRIVCAVDCGVAVNPDIIRQQIEGGIAYGLEAVLHGAITLRDGQVEQSNFHDYRVLRMGEMPRVEVHIIPSAEAPSGVGEPGTPVVGPAVANAIFALTGKPVRSLPLDRAGWPV